MDRSAPPQVPRYRSWLKAGDVPAAAHRFADERIYRVVDAAHHLGDPLQTLTQDPIYPTLKSGRTDRARTARTLELHLDHTGLHIGRDESEVTTISLHRWPHQFDDGGQSCEPFGALLVRKGHGNPIRTCSCVLVAIGLRHFGVHDLVFPPDRSSGTS